MTAEIIPVYKGEAMLIRWAENHKGRTLTLELDPTIGEKHPFFGLKCGENGQRMQLCAVLVDDHEEPMTPPQVGTKAEAGTPAVKSKEEKKPLTRSQVAALKLRQEDFQIWLAEQYPSSWDKYYIDHNMLSPETADAVFKEVINIGSKRELDTDQSAADRFDRLMADYSVKDIRR